MTDSWQQGSNKHENFVIIGGIRREYNGTYFLQPPMTNIYFSFQIENLTIFLFLKAVVIIPIQALIISP